MGLPILSVSRRLRRTPFTDQIVESGVKSYTVYNRMLLPTSFESVEDDYHHLKRDVQIWDVSCERQIEIIGPDAATLVQRLTPRNLATMKIGQCRYIPVVDETGGMINDPVLLKLADDRFWISIADSDLIFWIKGLAQGSQYNAKIFEPDVHPLAIQGPKSDELAARIFGPEITQLGFFKFAPYKWREQTLYVGRSGYSRQGGFEIYLQGFSNGAQLFNDLMEAGADLNVRAGCPNLIERIEGGLLSYGNDMTSENSPFECGLGKFCNLDIVTNCFGFDGLREEFINGPKQQIRSLSIDGPALMPCTDVWSLYVGNELAGHITSAAWSPDFNTNVALGMVHKKYWDAGTVLTAKTPDGERQALIMQGSFADQ